MCRGEVVTRTRAKVGVASGIPESGAIVHTGWKLLSRSWLLEKARLGS